jgi:AcrR family transcriptional regulator
MANDMQANILRHALVLFAEQGYEGVSVRNIASAAGITLPLIYHYFPDKQAVYDAAVHDAFAYMTERMIGAVRVDLLGEAKLRAFLEQLVELQAAGAPEVRLVDRELMEARPETMAKLGADLFQRPHDALAQIIRELAPHAPAQEVAEHIIAATYGAVKLRAIRIHVKGVERLAEVPGIVDSLVAFTLAALRDMDRADCAPPKITSSTARPQAS